MAIDCNKPMINPNTDTDVSNYIIANTGRRIKSIFIRGKVIAILNIFSSFIY